MSSIALRPPTFSSAKPPPTYTSPTVSWLTETWTVTHSTLPMWKNKRNVKIQYTPLPPSDASIKEDDTDRIDDLVTYQSVSDEKVHAVHGVDKLASSGDSRDSWNWRGKGWLMIASSHWEILGWGEEEGSGNKWVVTMFAKTLFTPAGVDVYSKDVAGLREETVDGIKKALQQIDDEGVKQLSGELFEIKHDGGD